MMKFCFLNFKGKSGMLASMQENLWLWPRATFLFGEVQKRYLIMNKDFWNKSNCIHKSVAFLFIFSYCLFTFVLCFRELHFLIACQWPRPFSYICTWFFHNLHHPHFSSFYSSSSPYFWRFNIYFLHPQSLPETFQSHLNFWIPSCTYW